MQKLSDKTYYIYVIRCFDNSLYTGITTDVKRRFEEHTTRRSSGEKYTRSKKAMSIEAVWSCLSRALASKLEYALKHLTREKKESLIANPQFFNILFSEKLNVNSYVYLEEYKGYK